MYDIQKANKEKTIQKSQDSKLEFKKSLENEITNLNKEIYKLQLEKVNKLSKVEDLRMLISRISLETSLISPKVGYLKVNKHQKVKIKPRKLSNHSTITMSKSISTSTKATSVNDNSIYIEERNDLDELFCLKYTHMSSSSEVQERNDFFEGMSSYYNFCFSS